MMFKLPTTTTMLATTTTTDYENSGIKTEERRWHNNIRQRIPIEDSRASSPSFHPPN